MPVSKKQTQVISRLKNDFEYPEFRDTMMEALMKVDTFENLNDVFLRAEAFKFTLQEYLEANPLN